MRRLVLVFLVVLVGVGVVGVRAESAPKSASKSASKPASTSYWQVVDNATEDRFEADESWGKSSYRLDTSDDNHRFAYRFARPAKHGTPAQFKLDIPETANYAVYASWPEVKGLSGSVPVGVQTTSGLQWTRVNQQQDGGRWVRIGTFEMAAGDDYAVQISPTTDGEGYVAADAVEVVKVPSDTSSSEKPPENDSSTNSKNQDAAKEAQPKESGSRESGSPREVNSAGSSRGQAVVNEARTYMGTRYRLGGTSRSGVDCSGFTMLVYRKFGVSLPHDVTKQSHYGSRVSGSPQAGDLVFFNEHGRGLSHVGIATGRGTLVHASDYFNKVTETQMKYVRGYVGAKRLLK